MRKGIYTKSGYLLSTRTKTQRKKLISWASKFLTNSIIRRFGRLPDVPHGYRSYMQFKREGLKCNTDKWILDTVARLKAIEKFGLEVFWKKESLQKDFYLKITS